MKQSFILLALATISLLADDIITTDGKTYKDVKVITDHSDAFGIAIEHSSGAAKVPFGKMADPDRLKYGHDPVKEKDAIEVVARRKAEAEASRQAQLKAEQETARAEAKRMARVAQVVKEQEEVPKRAETKKQKAELKASKGDGNSPYFGLNVADTGDVAPTMKKNGRRLPSTDGAVVCYIDADSPAEVAGFELLDVVTKIGGKAIHNSDEFCETVDRVAEVGEKCSFYVHRGNSWSWRSSSQQTLSIDCKAVTKKAGYLAAMRQKKDTVTGQISYYHRDSPRSTNQGSECFLYITHAPGEPPRLRLRIQYVAKDWLFIQMFVLKAGEKTFTLDPPYNAIKRDNGVVGDGTAVWEWYDHQVSEDELHIVKAIMRCDNGILRHQGNQYYNDREFTLAEQCRLQTVLKVFEYMTGN